MALIPEGAKGPSIGRATPRFQAFLEDVFDAEDFLARIRPDSAKGGAAMRAGVFGLLEDERSVLDGAAAQAALTHLTPVGIASVQGAALMVHHQARGLGPISALPDYLAARVPAPDWSRPHRTKVGQDGGELVRTALGVLPDSKGLREVLIRSVSLGGDTDTTAAVAMAAASVSAELARDLPESLFAGLEDGPYGLRFLASIDRRLAERFGLPAVSAGGGS